MATLCSGLIRPGTPPEGDEPPSELPLRALILAGGNNRKERRQHYSDDRSGVKAPLAA